MGINRGINPWVSTLPDPSLVPQYRGDWANLPYELADVVLYGNSLYIAVDQTTAFDIPKYSNKWKVIIDSSSVDNLRQEYTKAISDISNIETEVTQLYNNVLDQQEKTNLALQYANDAQLISLTQGGVVRFTDSTERNNNPRPDGTWAFTLDTSEFHRFENGHWAKYGDGVVSKKVLYNSQQITQYSNPSSFKLTPLNPLESYRLADGTRWKYYATSPDGKGIDGGVIVAGYEPGSQWRREFFGGIDAAWYGVVNTGVDVSTNYKNAVAASKTFGVPLYIKPLSNAPYNLGQGVVISDVGNDVCIEANENAVFTSIGDGTKPIIDFKNVGSNFVLTGGTYKYASAPTQRQGSAALGISGAAIVNTKLENITVDNGSNFAIWVIGTNGTGCNTIRIQNIRCNNTLGDGVHVENFDHTVLIENIFTDTNGDDAVAVINYTGPDTPDFKAHPAQTVNVIIKNVISYNPMAATIKLVGVKNCIVQNVTVEGGNKSNDPACTVFQFSVSDNYQCANDSIFISNVIANKVQVFASLIKVSNNNQSKGNTNITFKDIKASNIGTFGIRVQGGSAADKDTASIKFENVEISGDGSDNCIPFKATQVVDLTLTNVSFENFGNSYVQIDNSDIINLNGVINKNPSRLQTDNSIALSIYNSKNIVFKKLIVSDPKNNYFFKGIEISGNDIVTGKGECSVVGCRNKQMTTSNSNATGEVEVIKGTKFLGSVQIGTATKLTWPRPVLGSVCHLEAIVNSNNPFKWGTRNIGNVEGEFVWGEGEDNVNIMYTLTGLVG